MTAAQAVETSVTNSLSQDYSNLDDLLLTITNMYRFSRVQIIYFKRYLRKKPPFTLINLHKPNPLQIDDWSYDE